MIQKRWQEAVTERLILEPASVKELSRLTGMSRPSISRFLGVLKAQKRIHIHTWRDDAWGRCCVPVYAYGDEIDMPKVRRPSFGAWDCRPKKRVSTKNV